MPRPNWTKVSDSCYLYTVGGIDFKIEYKAKEIKADTFENRWLFTGSIDHHSWYEHILPCVSSYYEEAQIEAENVVVEAISKEMKYHLDLGNKFAQMLSEAILNGNAKPQVEKKESVDEFVVDGDFCAEVDVSFEYDVFESFEFSFDGDSLEQVKKNILPMVSSSCKNKGIEKTTLHISTTITEKGEWRESEEGWFKLENNTLKPIE